MHVVVVSSNDHVQHVMTHDLGGAGYGTTPARSLPECASALAHGDVSAVIADADALGAACFRLCSLVIKEYRLPVLVVASRPTPETALGAIRSGADDLVFLGDGRAVVRAIERISRRRAIDAALTGPPPDATERLIGDGLTEVRRIIDQVGGTTGTVLISGETGTGKSAVAACIHDGSSRRDGPLVVVSCAALTESLLESELFGHERGAFTDAVRSRRGLLLEATGGTFVLDDVGSLPLNLQAKLLRALQERVVRPLGGSASASFDVRVIALAGADLDREVDAGRFRSDLFFRLNVIRIKMPPLRERGLDVIALARTFLARAAAAAGKPVADLSLAAADKLLTHDWPGNVRELQNCIDSAVAVARYVRLTPADIRLPIRPPEGRDVDPRELVPLDAIEMAHIARVMKDTGGNVSRAAALLDVDRKTLYRKLRIHGLGDLGRDEDDPSPPTRKFSLVEDVGPEEERSAEDKARPSGIVR